MADDSSTTGDRADGISGRDLQQSQATGATGGGMDMSREQGEVGGAQLGGGPDPSDMRAPGGSSGSGGYGNAQNQANHQGQQQQGRGHDEAQSRGEAYDEAQGGGRGPGSVSPDSIAQSGGGGSFDQHRDADLDAAADELLRDQREHQDRGQGDAEDFERDAES